MKLTQMEMRGIEPRASRMQSERSTIWAASPFAAYFVVKYHFNYENHGAISTLFKFEGKEQICSVLKEYQNKNMFWKVCHQGISIMQTE